MVPPVAGRTWGFLLSPAEQQLGTLVGLKHALVLEAGLERRVLIPHARIRRKSREPGGDVCLDIDQLRTPPLFECSG